MTQKGGAAPKKTSGNYFDGFDEVFRLEIAEIRKRRPSIDERDLTGLALSGGGIRSAAFSFGVVQRLQVAGKIEQVHYLSTVSGGGYTGSSLTWFLSRKDGKGKPCFGVRDKPFPFTGGEAAALRRSGEDEAGGPGRAKGGLAGRPIVDYIRQRSSYLLPGAGIDMVSAFAIVMRSVVISLFGYLLLASLFGLLILKLGVATWGFAGYPLFLEAAAALVGLLLASMIAYSVFAPMPWKNASYEFRYNYQRWAGLVLRCAAGFALFGIFLLVAVPSSVTAFPRLGLDPYFIRQWAERLLNPTAAAAAGGVGALGGLLTRKLVKANPGLLVRLALPLVPPLALLLLAFALLAGGLCIALGVSNSSFAVGWIGLLIGFLFYSLYANLNLTGLHRFYRDRLMETFMPRVEDVREDRRNAKTNADTAALAGMFPEGHEGPYHLINTNLVLLDGKLARYRSRGSDSFFLSPLFCGSESTGFVRTEHWTPGISWLIRAVGPLTLPTAMAISAAALNPRTGANGRGVTRRASVSTLLTILNLRLGCWLPSPQIDRWPPWLARIYPPNFVVPGLTQGLLSFGRNQGATWVELTDGGHFDNTGLYELARRRVKIIYFVDGTEDPETGFSSFANAVEKIFIDFDVKVDFGSDHSFKDLMVDSSTATGPHCKRFRLAKSGFAVADLIYPEVDAVGGRPSKPEFKGKLYYIKATMTDDLPAALYAYKADNLTFPSESTADQFFTEQQFEAYRTLGFTLAKELTAYIAKQ
jgi:hypothetical protein